jgi:hypothetical protein
MQLASSIDAAGKLHRSFVGSRPLRGRLHFLRMTISGGLDRYFLYCVGDGPFSSVFRSQIQPSRL